MSFFSPRVKQTTRQFRPLIAWVIMLILFFAYTTHQRLSESTRLRFRVEAKGTWLTDSPRTLLDGQEFLDDQRISIGRHHFEVVHAKAENWSTNLFTWYGLHDLGTITLKRALRPILVEVSPPARELVIASTNQRLVFKNTTGVTSSVPTDSYSVEATWSHFQETKQLIVTGGGAELKLTPMFGALQLLSSHDSTRFSLFNSSGEAVEGGPMPQLIFELPVGRYRLLAHCEGASKTNLITVARDVTNSFSTKFEFGAVSLQTYPAGAKVLSDTGEELGKTPLVLPKVPIGTWTATVQLPAYQMVSIRVPVSANVTNSVRTNLVNQAFSEALKQARHYRDTGDFDQALKLIRQAIEIEPQDREAAEFESEINVARNVTFARTRIDRSDFGGARLALKNAQQLSPGDEAVKTLLQKLESLESEKQKAEQELDRRRRECVATLDQTLTTFIDRIYGEYGKKTLTLEFESTLFVSKLESALTDVLKNEEPRFGVQKIESSAPGCFTLFAAHKWPDGKRDCVFAAMQLESNRTLVRYRILEARVRKKLGLVTLLSGDLETELVPIVNEPGTELAPEWKAQLEQGQRFIREKLQKASRRAQ